MANTYTQLHHQFVFATKFRLASIDESWEQRLHKYITALVQDRDHKMLQINTMPDHLHMLIGMRPVQSISSLIQIVKSESARWINDERFCPRKFAWQGGFGAFSYSRSQVSRVATYIERQKEHHQKLKFIPEYERMLIGAQMNMIHGIFFMNHHKIHE